MDGGWLARLRWRRRGAWMWPLFGLLTVIDAVIGRALPAAGESESIGGAALLGAVVNLLALAVLSWPAGRLLRRRRPDLPMIVARDYAGSWLMAIAAAAVLAAGLGHRPTVLAHQRALREAIVRAQAWIGYRAPAEFRRQMRWRQPVHDRAGTDLPDLRPERDPGAHVLRGRPDVVTVRAQRDVQRL